MGVNVYVAAIFGSKRHGGTGDCTLSERKPNPRAFLPLQHWVLAEGSMLWAGQSITFCCSSEYAAHKQWSKLN